MVVVRYCSEYSSDIHMLWNSSGVRQGFVPADEVYFRQLIMEHPYFSADHAFVMIEEEEVRGFICGCAGEEVPGGNERGYFTCLLLASEAESKENGVVLLDALEDSFRQIGRKSVACTFFNPMKLPWIIPDTGGHLHNNAPGIAVDLPLYEWMVQHGYRDMAQESAMHLELKDFAMQDWVEDQASKAAGQGYTVEWYDKRVHKGLVSMVDSMGNAGWSAEIPDAAESINMIVALKGKDVVGFTGPVYPEESGRGYFAGIAVAREHEKQGLGTLLFYKLCQAEKEAGAGYMSLFTGSGNHARKIYQNAGFTEKRIFSVMVKVL